MTFTGTLEGPGCLYSRDWSAQLVFLIGVSKPGNTNIQGYLQVMLNFLEFIVTLIIHLTFWPSHEWVCMLLSVDTIQIETVSW